MISGRTSIGRSEGSRWSLMMMIQIMSDEDVGKQFLKGKFNFGAGHQLLLVVRIAEV